MADLLINKDEWDAVPAAEQKAIIDGLIQAGTLRPGERVVGDPSVPASTSRSAEDRWNPIKDICKIACDAAAGAGAAWCTANTVGVGLVACIAAAEVARQECRKRC